MKNITATILTLAMLASLTACGGNNDTPATTTATTTETPETTAPVEETVDIEVLLEGYTLHQMASAEFESFRETFPEDSALGKIAIEVTDYDGLYLLIEDEGITENNDGGYDRAKVRRVICGDVVQDCDITFAFGPSGFGLKKTDKYTIVSQMWYFSHHYIFHKDGCVYIPTDYGRDGGSLSLRVEEGVLKYTMENPKYTMMQAVFPVLDIIEDEHEWRCEWGTISVENGEVMLNKTKEQLWSDDNYLRESFEDVKGKTIEFSGKTYDFTQFETLEELLEYNRLKAEIGEAEAFLTTIPVYEYSYEDCRHFDEFDRIGGAEYAKYAAGEDFDEYYGIRITEYPDIALIGEVVTEPDKEAFYEQRGLNSVIYNGERHYLPEFNPGNGGYGLHVTDDIICVSAGASHYFMAYFIYDGGTEFVEFAESEYFPRPLDLLYVSDGELKWSCYSPQYSGVRFAHHYLSENYISPDDCLYYDGTVTLENGKIKVDKVSHTVGEWYVSETALHEKSGTTDVSEFMVWLKDNIRSIDVHIDPIGMYAP